MMHFYEQSRESEGSAWDTATEYELGPSDNLADMVALNAYRNAEAGWVKFHIDAREDAA